jgi:HD-GYP domain-containing protein (c-di-GMP phosphodiesterase class II)
VGARIVSALGLPSEVSQVVSCHHERWDGSGYPHRLRGERIPFLARIVGIAEAFDHLTGQIFGRAPLTIDDAILRISLESHTRFDPVLIDIFVEVLSKYKTSLPHMTISSPLDSGEPQIVATVRVTH